MVCGSAMSSKSKMKRPTLPMPKKNFLPVMISAFVAAATSDQTMSVQAASSVAYPKPTSTQVIKNAVPYMARPLPLSAVRLTGGPLKHAQDLDAEYLLQLEPDRMLYFLRLRAQLKK